MVRVRFGAVRRGHFGAVRPCGCPPGLGIQGKKSEGPGQLPHMKEELMRAPTFRSVLDTVHANLGLLDFELAVSALRALAKCVVDV